MSNDPKDDPPPQPQDLFPFDEMSTGETSSLRRRANVVTGAPDQPISQSDPALKPMTGAQLAFRPSAPPRPATGAHAAFKPGAKPATGTHAAFRPTEKPSTGTQPAFKPISGTQPALKPGAPRGGGTGTNTFAAFKPLPAEVEVEVDTAPGEDEPEEPPVFDPERLQAQIRAMSLTDSALGRAAGNSKVPKQTRLPSSATEDTFVKTKMKQAEAKVPDFDLDEDLG